MAVYKYLKDLKQSDDGAFDAIHHPGDTVPFSGIYYCQGCGHSVVSDAGTTLPPQNHHQHNEAQGAIRWRLAVSTH